MNSAEAVQRALDQGTFFKILMDETNVSPAASEEPGMMRLSLELPSWFYEYISPRDQADIINHLKTEVPRMLEAHHKKGEERLDLKVN